MNLVVVACSLTLAKTAMAFAAQFACEEIADRNKVQDFVEHYRDLLVRHVTPDGDSK